MSDYKLTRDTAGNVTTQYSQMLKNLTDGIEDAITAKSLIESHKMNNKYDKVDHADEWIDPDYKLLEAIETVLEYYMSPPAFNSFMVNAERPVDPSIKDSK